MTDVKEAVKRAVQLLAGMYGPVESQRLEEIEMNDDGDEWLVTISMLVDDDPSQFGLIPYGKSKRRVHKQVRMSAVDGGFLALVSRPDLDRPGG